MDEKFKSIKRKTLFWAISTSVVMVLLTIGVLSAVWQGDWVQALFWQVTIFGNIFLTSKSAESLDRQLHQLEMEVVMKESAVDFAKVLEESMKEDMKKETSKAKRTPKKRSSKPSKKSDK